MKKYAYIKDGKVNQFLYAFSEDFPNVPLDEMFAKEIVANCVEIDENDETIKEGMLYDLETGQFSEPVEEVEEIVEEVEEAVEEVEEVEENGEQVQE